MLRKVYTQNSDETNLFFFTSVKKKTLNYILTMCVGSFAHCEAVLLWDINEKFDQLLLQFITVE